MDRRDMSFWLHQANVVHVARHLERIMESRLAMVSGDDYERVVYPLKMELARLRAWKSQEEVIRENWDDMLEGR